MAGINWLDKLFAAGLGAVSRVYYAGAELVNRAVVEYTGGGVSVADSPGTGRTVVTIPGVAASFTSGLPVSVGTSNERGVLPVPARLDHQHNHANQPGGTLHALASDSVAGFMSAADKTKLDTVDNGATVNSITAGTGIAVTGTSKVPIVSLNPAYVATTDHPGLMSQAQFDELNDATTTATPNTIPLRGASSEIAFGPITSPSVSSDTSSITVRTSDGHGVDVDETVASFHHSVGGVEISGATYANIAAGDINLTASVDMTVSADTLTLSGTNTVLKTTTADVTLDSKTGTLNVCRDGSSGALFNVHPTGAFSVVPATGATSVTYQQAQASVGVGKDAVYGAQKGAAGSIGGRAILGSETGGTPGTNLAGGTRCELGSTVAGYSAYHDWTCAGTRFAGMRKHVSFGGGSLEGTGAIWVNGTSGAYIGSSDDSIRLALNQSDAGATLIGAYLENGGQYSSAINKIAVAATVNINWNLSNTVWVGSTNTSKVTTNVSVAAPTNPREGNITYWVRAISDGTHTWTWNAVFTFPASGNGINQWAAGVPADGKILLHGFLWNGTAYECIASCVI